MFLLFGNFVLIVFTVYAVTRKPEWTSYSDKVLSVCLPKRTSLTMLEFAINRASCIVQQRLYLQCIPTREAFSSYLVKPSTCTKPCGFIRSRPYRNSRNVKWDISVPHNFYLNMIFHRFSLPIAHGSCQWSQASEFVYITQKKPNFISHLQPRYTYVVNVHYFPSF